MTAAPSPPLRLQKMIKSAIKAFMKSAVALICIFVVSPEGTKESLEKLRSFTPELMFSLIQDAWSDCEHRPEVKVSSRNLPDLTSKNATNVVPHPDTPKPTTRSWEGQLWPPDWQGQLKPLDPTHELELSDMPRLNRLSQDVLLDEQWQQEFIARLRKDLAGPPIHLPGLDCRVRPLEKGWPTVGNWVEWLAQHGFRREETGTVTPVIALADVVVHLVVAPSIVATFVVFMQLVFGFGITTAIIVRIRRLRIPDYWVMILWCFGTLMIGSAVASVMLPLISVIFAGVESVMHAPVIASVVAIAISLSGASSIILPLLHWSREKATDKMTESLADKAARLLLRYVYV